jgi:hypothetical protein
VLVSSPISPAVDHLADLGRARTHRSPAAAATAELSAYAADIRNIRI